MKSKVNFRLIAKVGLLLVVIGFLMPVACDLNGFQLIDAMFDADMQLSAILMIVLFASAVAGCAIGVMLLMKMKKVKVLYDWVCILVCIASGLIVYFRDIEKNVELQTGGLVICIGFAIALAAQVISKVNKEK